MNNQEVIKFCLDTLMNAGADKAQCFYTEAKKHELNIDVNELSLVRTTSNINIELSVIKNNRLGVVNINKNDKEEIKKAADEAIMNALSAPEDIAFDISPPQESKSFISGESLPDKEKMYNSLTGFLEDAKIRFPFLMINQAFLSFNKVDISFGNTNDTFYNETKGFYNLSMMFTSKKNGKSSSFNSYGYSTKDLEKSIMESGLVADMLKESEEQIYAKPFEGKFVGEVIVSPDCFEGLLHEIARISLADQSIITGTSKYKGEIGNKVASDLLDWCSSPTSDEIASGYRITSDGYEAKDTTIIEAGILKSYLLTQYGSKKTGIDRSGSSGGAYIINAGETALTEMIKGVKKGVLFNRFSGGSPSSNGDFSGIAKNSFYIENGEIMYPLSETMLAGNLFELIKNITEISKERIDSGSSIVPWVKVSGITISGK